jgi:hypothetical protein
VNNKIHFRDENFSDFLKAKINENKTYEVIAKDKIEEICSLKEGN